MSTDAVHAEPEIRRFLGLLVQPGQAFEIRAPGCRERRGSGYAFTCAGYFTFEALDQAAREIVQLERAFVCPGIYVTLNPVKPDLLARALNRIQVRVRETAQDKDILGRNWLLVDVDAQRPTGVSATDAELHLALERVQVIRTYLTGQDWPAPVLALSGNGYHLLYRLHLPADDGGWVQRVLNALAERFGDDAVVIDRTVHNPARITKVIGTLVRKGDELRGVAGVENRPHRRSALLDVPSEIVAVTAEQLEAVAGAGTTTPAVQTHPRSDDDSLECTPAGVRAWLEACGVVVRAERRTGDKTLLLLERCPVNPEIVSTGGSDIAVLVSDDGKLAYCNKHNRGRTFTWHDLRKALDPGYEPLPVEDNDVDLSGFKLCASPAGQRSGVDLSAFVPLPAGDAAPSVQPPTIAELIERYPQLRRPVIHGLIRVGESMNVIAPPKAGKSWLVTTLALACATGRPWLHAFPTEPCDVLILDNELHPETTAQRIPKVAEALGIALREYGQRICVQNMRGQLRDVFSLAAFFQALEPGRYGIIVLDAFYRFMPRDMDENDNGTMANIYNVIDRYADHLAACFVLIHHSTKGNQSAKTITDVGAGAGSQSRAADCHAVLRPHEEPGAAVFEAVVRSWPPVTPFALRWEYPLWRPAPDLDPAMLKSEKPKRAKLSAEESPEPTAWSVERFVEVFLSDQPVTKAQLRAAAQDEPGLSWRRVADLLDLAESQGLVHRWQVGKAHRVLYATIAQPTSEEEYS